MTRPTDTFDTARFALLDRLVRRLETAGVSDEVRATVDALTADADPARAHRLAVRPGEPPVLVQRLAVWALHRASDGAVAAAGRTLDLPEQAAAPLAIAGATDRGPANRLVGAHARA